MNIIDYIQNVEGISRSGKTYLKQSPKDNITLVSVLYSSHLGFGSLDELNDFINKNEEIKKNDYYLRLNGIKLSYEEIASLNVPIFVSGLNLNDYDKRIYDLKNVAVGVNNIDFEIFLKTQGRQLDKIKDLVISYLDSNVIKELSKYVNSNVELSFKVHDLNSLGYLKELLDTIEFKDKLKITLDDEFFDNENNRRLLYDDKIKKEITSIRNNNLKIYFRDNSFASLNDFVETQEIIEFIIDHIPSDSNDLDKVVFVTELLSRYISYDFFRCKIDSLFDKFRIKNPVGDMNLSDIVISGKGVCRHYARLAKYIFDMLGIKCDILNKFDETGVMDPGHAFNVVYIDGKNYYLDITWISNCLSVGQIKNCVESEYFLKSKGNFKHEMYLRDYDDFGNDMSEKEALESLKRVISYLSNYKIQKRNLFDLFNKRNAKLRLEQTMKGIGGGVV